MRAILKGDRLVKWSIDKGTEVGEPPVINGQTVGIERLRWNDFELVDLYDVPSATGFHVEPGNFMLHVVPLDNTQKVKMHYKDRKLLINDNGKIRLKKKSEIALEEILAYQNKRKAEYPDLDVQLGEVLKFIANKFYDDPDMTSGLKAVLHDVDIVKDKFYIPSGTDALIPSASKVKLKPH